MYYIQKNILQNFIRFKLYHFYPFPPLCNNPIHLSRKQTNQLDIIFSLENSCWLAVFPYLIIFCVFINWITPFTVIHVAGGKSCHSWRKTYRGPMGQPNQIKHSKLTSERYVTTAALNPS